MSGLAVTVLLICGFLAVALMLRLAARPYRPWREDLRCEGQRDDWCRVQRPRRARPSPNGAGQAVVTTAMTPAAVTAVSIPASRDAG